MRLLLDECVPRPLKKAFADHEILTVEKAGFKGLKNGALLRAASVDFDVLITVDKNIEHQQNTGSLPRRRLDSFGIRESNGVSFPTRSQGHRYAQTNQTG